ncbi:phosphoribosyltransferase [Actinospica robiniae]|uniref:phosphoribosyltransferase n=1 Tax=Actinospica robiniae TaxID=304901 RepID=UPI00040F2A0A|nr:phosphoribosyltransferase family protein [Actinospica robiniae]
MSGETVPFADREDAGRRLSVRVAQLGLHDPVVLGLPRGGVPIARCIADRLGVPVDVFVSRKIGLPGSPELGIAAIAEGSAEVVPGPYFHDFGLDERQVEALAEGERRELRRRVARYRGERALPDLAGREVVLADDGLATGVTATAAVRALRRWDMRRLIFAAPVCAPDAAARLVPLVDVVVSLLTPARFEAVGQWYERFEQLQDSDVIRLLAGAHPESGRAGR